MGQLRWVYAPRTGSFRRRIFQADGFHNHRGYDRLKVERKGKRLAITTCETWCVSRSETTGAAP
jgi:hypothetical protein